MDADSTERICWRKKKRLILHDSVRSVHDIKTVVYRQAGEVHPIKSSFDILIIISGKIESLAWGGTSRHRNTPSDVSYMTEFKKHIVSFKETMEIILKQNVDNFNLSNEEEHVYNLISSEINGWVISYSRRSNVEFIIFVGWILPSLPRKALRVWGSRRFRRICSLLRVYRQSSSILSHWQMEKALRFSCVLEYLTGHGILYPYSASIFKLQFPPDTHFRYWIGWQYHF